MSVDGLFNNNEKIQKRKRERTYVIIITSHTQVQGESRKSITIIRGIKKLFFFLFFFLFFSNINIVYNIVLTFIVIRLFCLVVWCRMASQAAIIIIFFIFLFFKEKPKNRNEKFVLV